MAKKVLRIIARLNIGGPAIHVTNLNYYLDRQYDYTSTLVFGSLAQGEGSMEYLAHNKNLKTISLPELGREISLIKDLKTIWKLYKIIRQEKPDIVHTHTAKAGTVGRVAAKLAGVKQIYHTFHGHVFHGYFNKIKTTLFILIERALALLTTQIIAISAKQQEDLINYKICPAKKIKIIPLGFELQKLTQEVTQNYWHKELGLPPQQKIIGIVGRLVPIKNHALFITVAEQVCHQRDDVTFLIIGDGELRQSLQELVLSKGLKNRVIFTGFEKDPGKIYADLDIVTLTSSNEGTPVTLIEAQAFNKPIVSVDVGGITDVVENNKSGYIVSGPQLAYKLSNYILELLNNPQLAQAMGQAGRQAILSKYDVSRLTKDINHIYNQ